MHKISSRFSYLFLSWKKAKLEKVQCGEKSNTVLKTTRKEKYHFLFCVLLVGCGSKTTYYRNINMQISILEASVCVSSTFIFVIFFVYVAGLAQW